MIIKEGLIQLTPRDFESERINYEVKIREQSQSLYEMHEYIMLCEERIKQLCPDHELPVTERHIKSPIKGTTITERLKKENETLRLSCIEKDKVRIK
jgi:hypothetical protein